MAAPAVPGWKGPYRSAWWTVATTLTLLGVAGGALGLGGGGALFLLAIVACLTAFGVGQLRPRTGAGCRAATPIAAGLLGGLIALAAVGLIVEFGPAGWWISVLIAAAGWPIFGRQRPESAVPNSQATTPTPGPPVPNAAGGSPRAAGRRPVCGAPAIEMLPPEPLPELSALPSLSTPQLCWAWRVSYLRVQRSTCGSQLKDVARLRRGYLDELQARDPAAFDHWFPTARAASDPARFFCPPQSHTRGTDHPSPSAPGAAGCSPAPTRTSGTPTARVPQPSVSEDARRQRA